MAADVLNFHDGRRLMVHAVCVHAEQYLDSGYADGRWPKAEQCAAGKPPPLGDFHISCVRCFFWGGGRLPPAQPCQIPSTVNCPPSPLRTCAAHRCSWPANKSAGSSVRFQLARSAQFTWSGPCSSWPASNVSLHGFRAPSGRLERPPLPSPSTLCWQLGAFW